MLKKNKKVLLRIFRLADLSIIVMLFLCISYIDMKDRKLVVPNLANDYQLILLIYVFIWIYFSNFFGLYDSKRISSVLSKTWDVTKITTICCMILFLFVVFGKFSFRIDFIFKIWSTQLICLLLIRKISLIGLKHLRKQGYKLRQVLIVGTNSRAIRIAREIEEDPELGVRVLGYVDSPNGREHQKHSNDLKFLGYIEDLREIIENQVVDEVFILLPIKSFYSEIENIIQFCETIGVEVKIPTDLFNVRLYKSTISKFYGSAFINLYASPILRWQLLAKRFIDLVVSLVILVLLSPILIVVSILIKMNSQGPVLFKQQRVGCNGRLFTLFKFRTMVQNAEELRHNLLDSNEMDGPVFKIKNDPRITSVGRVLRKTSMDEFPQLINVLMGDMSLVGPRPPLLSEVQQYDLTDRRRLSVKPGITGIWQVCGRNAIPFEKWMELDREYIDHWSLWLDVKILVKTIPAVLRGSGV